jgi:hypothetical protein
MQAIVNGVGPSYNLEYCDWIYKNSFFSRNIVILGVHIGHKGRG